MAREHKFGRALRWAYLMNWGRQGFSTFFSLFLAALLGPEAFGIIAIAMIYILFIQMLLDQGLMAALVQRKDLRVEHLDSVFWLVLSTSLLLVFGSVSLSRWWAQANHSAMLVKIIGALSVCILIEGLAIVQRALFQRDMDFRSLSLCTNVSVCAGGSVGIGMALTGFGVWALVGQQVSQDIVALFMLWQRSSWRPRWRFSLSSLRELLGFSFSNFLAKMGVFTNTQADSLLLGLFFGPIAVGLYRLAERVESSVMNLLSASLQTASFPQFSRLQDKPEDLRKSVLTCIRISAIGTFPAMAGLTVTSNLLFEAIGPKWSDAADVLKLLCLVGMIYAVGQFVGPLLQALAKPHYLAVLTWSQATVGTALTALVAFHLRKATVWSQIVGVAGVRLTISVLMGALVIFVLLPRLCRVSGRDLLHTVGPALAAAGVVIGLVLLLSWLGLTHRWSPIPSLFAVVSLGATAGITTLYALDDVVRPTVNSQVHRFLRRRRESRQAARPSGAVIGRVWLDPK
jgi:O-antigen/teichoic acid export membrane protein